MAGMIDPALPASEIAKQAGFPLAGQVVPPVMPGAPAPAAPLVVQQTPAEWIRALVANALPSREAQAQPPASPGMAALQRGAVIPPELRKPQPNFFENAVNLYRGVPPGDAPAAGPRSGGVRG